MDPDSISTIDRNPANFYLKNIALFGANNTGKTTLLLDIMHQLRDLIPIVYAFTGTPGAYDAIRGIVPDVMISRKLTVEALQKIYARQEDAKTTYDIANNPAILQSIFRRIAGKTQLHAETSIFQIFDESNEKATSSELSSAERASQCKKIRQVVDQYLVQLYKSVIRRNMPVLLRMDLTEVEKRAVKFLDFNPNILVLVDDCASMITRKMQNTETFKNFYFMYRHVFITFIGTYQDDTNLEADMRKQVCLNFFTSQQCASAYFDRSANNFMREMKIAAGQVIRTIFSETSGMPQWTKMLYIRDDKIPLRKYLAEEHGPFILGSKVLWDMCKRIEQKKHASKAASSTFGVY